MKENIRKLFPKPCLMCGKLFQPILSVAKYCSRQCSGKAVAKDPQRIEKIRKSKLGIKRPYLINTGSIKTMFKKGQAPWIKGKKGLFTSPRKGVKLSEFTKQKISRSKTGKPSKFRGENHWAWKGGHGTERHQLMKKTEYILWRTAVFIRDNYTCQQCFNKGNYLEADHIKPWALYPELRYSIDNGRTLCRPCHRQTDTWGRRVYKRVS